VLTIADRERYARYGRHRSEGRWLAGAAYEPGLAMLLFGSIGAITWAIRGTTGWGGIDGTIVPGLTWGLLWYYLCARRGIDARGIVFWLGMGIALGGELGYGQYVSWIQGRFNVGDEVIPVSPLTGYLWFIICGIGWGAPGGIVLGWALGKPAGARQWTCRVALMGILLVLLFNLGGLVLGQGIIEWLGERFVRWCPGLLYPNADLGIYAGELDRHLGRTVYTNTQNCAVLLWWAAAMGLAAFHRDRATLVAGAVIGGGFGPGFAIAAAWCHGYTFAPDAVDWWKVWELHSGFNLGLLYAIVMYWSLRQLDQTQGEGGSPPVSVMPRSSMLLAFAGFALVFAAGFEYFFWTSLALGTFYVAAMFLAVRVSEPGALAERSRSVSLIYSAFLLIFILLHGVSSRAGVLFEFYGDDAIDQYAWPPSRIALFAATLWAMRRALAPPAEPRSRAGAALPERMFDLLTFIGIVGAASIWPSKIGVLYAVFLAPAIFALARLNRYFGKTDTM
jgi:hypothetical protein